MAKGPQLITALGDAVHPMGVMQRVTDRTLELMTAAMGVMVGLVEDGGVTYVAGSGNQVGLVGTRVEVGHSLSGLSIRTGEVLRSDDTEDDARVDLEACRRHHVRSLVCVPLQREGRSVGVLAVNAPEPNVFSDEDGNPTPLFYAHIAGLQKYLPSAMALIAPNVNSYRRINRTDVAPINVQWGYDNRTAAFRVPQASPQSRRIENRVPGADANPYLAMAASLACGYLGMIERLQPTQPWEGSAHDAPYALPRSVHEALRTLTSCDALKQVLGERFVTAFVSVKQAEYEAFFQVISSWEREYLLLNV